MTAIILRPILPWAGAQEEDRRFRRILVLVLALFLLASAILPNIPLPLIETERYGLSQLPAVRLIARPVVLLTSPSEARQPVVSPSPSNRIPQQENETVAAASREPAKAESVPPPLALEQPVQPIPERQEPRATADTIGTKARNRRQSQEPEDPVAAARKKVEKSGVLALSDRLAALRAFNPTPLATPRRSSATTNVALPPDKKDSLLESGMDMGSGGIDDALPAPRKLLGDPGEGGARAGASRGVVTLFQEPPVGSVNRPSVMGGNNRSEEEIQEILDRNKHAIYTLYNRELRVDPLLQGKVVVSITIAPSGKVTACTIDYSELRSDTLKRGLIRLIRGIDFGAKEDVPSVTTKVPIEFFPV